MTAFPAADGRLTPDAIRSYAFPSARFGRRGLDEGHVWEFCRLAEREVVRLLNERTSLAGEVQRLRQRVLGAPAAGTGPDTPAAQDGSERGELEAQLAYLRTFSDVYRTHLHAYLDKLLRHVEEWDRAEKETLTAVHADMSAPPDVPPLPPLPPIPQ